MGIMKKTLRRTGMIDLRNAIALAVEAHLEQTDWKGEPFILHPMRVMFKFVLAKERMAAILHDTVEDTYISLSTLRNIGFDEETIETIDALTKRRNEDYLKEYILRVSKNALATRIKMEDLKDNMKILRLPRLLTAKDLERLAKYQKAFLMLESTLLPGFEHIMNICDE